MLLAQTLTLASNVKNLPKEISPLGKSSYSNVLKNAHLVLSLTATMNVCLVKVVLNVLVHLKLIVLAVTAIGDKILMKQPKLLLVSGKVSSNLLSIKSKQLVVNKLNSKKQVKSS